MPVRAAGVLLYRIRNNRTEVLLIHPGGPFYRKREEGIWSIPKGLMDAGEEPLNAAIREFMEETGMTPKGPFVMLPEVRYGSGKRLTAFASEGDFDPANLISNTFSLEWPPKSGKFVDFPEADRAGWFDLKEAAVRILPAQLILLNAVEEITKK
jgi:predicted NUDIX family NTP pyrophosphohydrolase